VEDVRNECSEFNKFFKKNREPISKIKAEIGLGPDHCLSKTSISEFSSRYLVSESRTKESEDNNWISTHRQFIQDRSNEAILAEINIHGFYGNSVIEVFYLGFPIANCPSGDAGHLPANINFLLPGPNGTYLVSEILAPPIK
jgi:hypothetical protein